MQIKEFIKKLQNLSSSQKKVILWVIVIIFGIILLVFWWNYTKEKIKGIDLSKTIQQFMPQNENKNGQ